VFAMKVSAGDSGYRARFCDELACDKRVSRI
jgi:hypothetical protein